MGPPVQIEINTSVTKKTSSAPAAIAKKNAKLAQNSTTLTLRSQIKGSALSSCAHYINLDAISEK